ncbi:MAG: hypothetical protein AAF488_01355 [Planctomycetota bacterium]
MNEPTLHPPRLALPMIGLTLVLTGLGLVAGWMIGQGSGTADPGGHGHGHGHGHGADKGAAAGAPTFDETTRINLGIQTGEIQPSSYTVTTRIPGVITETPFSNRPVATPIGGRIEKILVLPGQRVTAGQPLLTIVRDRLPPPELTMTSAILQPASEEIHETVAALREARQEREIIDAELQRVREFAEGALPRKTVIDLEYNRMRVDSRFVRARDELAKHGFTEAQVERVSTGGEIPHLDARLWQRALDKNGLWPDTADRLYAALPEPVRARLWTVSSIGELAARGLDSEELIAWITEDATAGPRFTEIAALVQLGHSVTDVRQLHRLGALDPMVTIRAPEGTGGDTPDWDVHHIEALIGQHVDRGDVLLDLVNPRQLHLIVEPTGSEKNRVVRAASASAELRATPLFDAGPELTGLRVRSVSSADRSDTTAIVPVQNQVAASHTDDGRNFRVWALRPGLAYDLRLPTNAFEKVYVVPISAIAEQGPKKVVYVPDGDSYRSIPVVVAYSDADVAVIPIDAKTRLFPGDTVVLDGAFEIGLALNQGAAIDPHAGHSH